MKAANQGEVESLNTLGNCYEKGGRGVPKDPQKAMEYFRKAADKGLASAQFNLASCYQRYVNTPEGLKHAFDWYTKAANQKHIEARFYLGLCYEKGYGVPVDLKAAMKIYEELLKEGYKKQEVADRMKKVTQRTQQETSKSQTSLENSSVSKSTLQKTISSIPVKEEQKSTTDKSSKFTLSFVLEHHELQFSKEIGRGAFGIVYQGTYRYNHIAIKQLHLTNPSQEASEEFKQEMQLMANLRCPQIVQLYGVYLKPSYGIVMEYMPNGSLYSVLHSNKPLDWQVRYSIAVDMSKGVAFLHKENVLHRDLKSLNVLLDKHMQAKLTDFGLAKVKNESSSVSSNNNNNNNNNQVAGTLLWMAPELFKRRAQCTKQSDIYSLGMTLWELASRELPFKDATSKDLIPKWVSEGEREEVPKDTPPKLAKMITWCWDGEASKRPIADQVVEGLKLEDSNDNIQILGSQPKYFGNLSGFNRSFSQK